MNQQQAEANPFILTLSLDEGTTAFFNGQRQQHFPAVRNFLQAHLTLFHYLPLPAAEIVNELKRLTMAHPPFIMQVTGVVSIGKGVAYKFESSDLQRLHRQMQEIWKTVLKPQDVQKLWPHITVQNKVAPQAAKELLTHLKEGFLPFPVQAIGLSLWEYLGAPWKFIETVSFSSETHR